MATRQHLVRSRAVGDLIENKDMAGKGQIRKVTSRNGAGGLAARTGRAFGRPLASQNNVVQQQQQQIDGKLSKQVLKQLKVNDENVVLGGKGKQQQQQAKTEVVQETKRPELQPAEPKLPVAFSSHVLPANVEDIDKDDESNILLATDYVKDIYAYLRKLEASQPIRANFLSVQREMTPKMRTVLVDWLINVHHQFRLLPETLYMGVALMDRFFQREVVSKDKIQLVGVTAFFIASKFEEIYPPDLMDFVVICDQLYTKKEIIKMEMVMLRVLNFELARPLPLHFLRRFSKAAHVDPNIHCMAKYLMEILLLDHEAAAWAPSLIAAAALYVTLRIFSNQGITWNESITYHTGYSEEELELFAAHLCKFLRRNEKSKFENCRKKYSTAKNLSISKAPELASPIIDELAAKA